MCCTQLVMLPAGSLGLATPLAGQVVRNGQVSIPLCIPEDMVPKLLGYVARTNSDEVIFLGKTYPPRTLKFIKFETRRASLAHFYGDMLLDFDTREVVGERAFLPLQDYVYG